MLKIFIFLNKTKFCKPFSRFSESISASFVGKSDRQWAKSKPANSIESKEKKNIPSINWRWYNEILISNRQLICTWSVRWQICEELISEKKEYWIQSISIVWMLPWQHEKMKRYLCVYVCVWEGWVGIVLPSKIVTYFAFVVTVAINMNTYKIDRYEKTEIDR